MMIVMMNIMIMIPCLHICNLVFLCDNNNDDVDDDDDDSGNDDDNDDNTFKII